jgi:hypothetical protein
MLSILSVPVTFKEVYTSNVRNFHINPNWTITEFIISIRPHISKAFHINQNSLEIIESGQYNLGIKPEAALPLIPDDTIKLKHRWGIKLDVAFYIRKKDFAYPQLNLNLNIATSSIVAECPVCFETVSLHSRYGCSHGICDTCHEQCESVSYRICPLCRQP